jgi:hypothetical protein
VRSPGTAIWKENDVNGYDKFGISEIPLCMLCMNNIIANKSSWYYLYCCRRMFAKVLGLLC